MSSVPSFFSLPSVLFKLCCVAIAACLSECLLAVQIQTLSEEYGIQPVELVTQLHPLSSLTDGGYWFWPASVTTDVCLERPCIAFHSIAGMSCTQESVKYLIDPFEKKIVKERI